MIVEGEMNVGPAILLGLWLSKNRRSLMKKIHVVALQITSLCFSSHPYSP